MTALRLGTRGSDLALTQSRWVASELEKLGYEVELVVVTTKGDLIQDKPLPEIGGKGLFTAELEEGLLKQELDLAVHSLKDLPVEDPEGLTVAGIPVREVPFDALIMREGDGLDALPQGASFGSSSTRRKALLLAQRPDLQFEDLRGNVPTRLRKVDEGQVDATLLAAAGLRRLGMGDRAQVLLEPPHFLPAPGQGALGIQAKRGTPGAEAAARMDHLDTRLSVVAERAFLEGLGGGCSSPVGAYGQVIDGELVLHTTLISLDGTTDIRGEGRAPAADEAAARALGHEVAKDVLARGGAEILQTS